MEYPKLTTPSLQHSITPPTAVAHLGQSRHVARRTEERPLIIISTRLPPQICGIGTFSWLLEQHWAGDASQHRFVVVDNGGQSAERITEFGGDWKTLGRALDQAGAADVLLHYAGRAYHRYGCPVRLPGVLQQWKKKFPTGRLFIFFHELPGRLPVLSRHYWLNLCNRRIVRQLANLADLVITNTNEHVRTLEKLSAHRNIPCLSIPANIERIAADQENRERTEFVIFGLPYGRWQTLLAFDREIRDWQQTGVLKKLHLIGITDAKFDLRSEALLKTYPQSSVVIRHGQISPEQISELLSRAQFALTTADELTWSKSSTFMSFLGHGCAVVAKSKFGSEPLSFTITPDQVRSISDPDLRLKSAAGRQWYEANATWNVLARNISGLINQLPTRDR